VLENLNIKDITRNHNILNLRDDFLASGSGVLAWVDGVSPKLESISGRGSCQWNTEAHAKSKALALGTSQCFPQATSNKQQPLV